MFHAKRSAQAVSHLVRMCMGFRVQGFMVQGLGFQGFRVQALGFRVQGLGFQGLGFRVFSVYMYIHTNTYACSMHVCMYVCMYVCLQVYTYACMSVCLYVYVGVSVCMCKYVCAGLEQELIRCCASCLVVQCCIMIIFYGVFISSPAWVCKLLHVLCDKISLIMQLSECSCLTLCHIHCTAQSLHVVSCYQDVFCCLVIRMSAYVSVNLSVCNSKLRSCRKEGTLICTPNISILLTLTPKVEKLPNKS